MKVNGITDAELAELIRVTEEATTAFMQGDMQRYLALTGLPGRFPEWALGVWTSR